MCCSDKLHCCPKGSTCDVAAGTCNSNAHPVSWNELAGKDMDKSSSDDVQCPDHQSFCPDGETCCQLKSGDYGCCPYTQVVIVGHWNVANYLFVLMKCLLNPSVKHSKCNL